MYAIENKMQDVAIKLIEYGADVNARDRSKYGETALIYAIVKGMKNVVIKLKEYGAKIKVIENERQKGGREVKTNIPVEGRERGRFIANGL